jgi:hypothetical protein
MPQLPCTHSELEIFIAELDELLPQVCQPPIRLGMYPAADKEAAAQFMAEHGRNSTETDVWMVFSGDESAPEIDGHVEHAVCTAITGNGPRSEVHARLYTMLHTNLLPLRAVLAYARDCMMVEEE